MTLSDIPAFVISLTEAAHRRQECVERLASQGVDFRFFDGVCGETSGLLSTFRYNVDHPGGDFQMGPRQIGIYLSHWILWNALLVSRNCGWSNAPAFMVIEDDADFHPGWQDTINAALAALPADWDYLAPGNCDCGEPNPVVQCGPGVYEVRPLCTHCYIIRSSSLEKVIDPTRKVWAPLDLAMYFDAFPQMRVFSIMPRCVSQVGMNLNP